MLTVVQEAANGAALLAQVFCGTPRAQRYEATAAALTPRGRNPLGELKAAESSSPEAAADGIAADDAGASEEWEPDMLMARRRLKADPTVGTPRGQWDYLVRWKGRGEEEDCWVPESELPAAFIIRELEAAARENN